MTRPDPHRPDRRRSDADRIELALQAAGLGEFEWDLVRDVLTMSACAAEISGLSVGEQPARGGLTLSEPVHPDDRPDYLARRADNLGRGGPYKFEFRFIRPNDDRMIWLRISGVVVRRDENPSARLVSCRTSPPCAPRKTSAWPLWPSWITG
jgi:PAS domain-containing protein